jgi:poly(beta-D-mannuronate) lyase
MWQNPSEYRQQYEGRAMRSSIPAAFLAGAVSASVLVSTALACDRPPPPVRDLDLERFYSDSAGSVIDPRLAAEHEAAVAPLTAFLRHVVSDADQSIRKRDAAKGACAVQWIKAWAAGDAWLGNMNTAQAEYQRKWDLAGVALAYNKVKIHAKPADQDVIEPWLIRFADASRAFFDDPKRRRNNQWYWLGLGLAATSLATGSERHWQEARNIMTDAAGHIAGDGTMELELQRGKRALYYHAFSLTPLVVMTELARTRGEDWYAIKDGALHRLVDVTRKGVQDPGIFDKLAGTAQERPAKPGFGWLAVYKAQFKDKVEADWPQVPEQHRWLGGDVRLLMQALEARRFKP